MKAFEGAVVSYNFLHLKEYLAAFHLSQQPVEKQMEHFSKYINEQAMYMYRLLFSWYCSCKKKKKKKANINPMRFSSGATIGWH